MPIPASFADLNVVQAIFDAIPLPVFLKDREHRWVWVNQAFADWMGRSAEELLGRRDIDFVPESQARVFVAMDEHVFATGELHENEELLDDALGQTRVVVTRKQRVTIPDGGGRPQPYILAVVSDVTSFHEAEARAKRVEGIEASGAKILETLAQGAPLEEVLSTATRLVDEQLPGAHSAVLLHDPEQKLFWRVAGDQVSPELADVVRREDVDVEGGPCGVAAKRGDPVIVEDFEAEAIWADHLPITQELGIRSCWAHPIWNPAGEVVGVFVRYAGAPRTPDGEEIETVRRFCQLVGLAIERVRNDLRLQAVEERFRLLADHVDDVFWIRDAVASRRIYISPAYEKLWGRPVADLQECNHDWADSVHEADREHVAAAREATDDTYQAEYRIVRPDGSVRWVFDRGVAVRTDGGEVRWFVGVARDITPLKEAEQALRLSEERFRIVAAMSADAVYDWDLVAGKLWWKRGAIDRTIGEVRQQLQDWAKFIHPDDRERVESGFRAALAGRDAFWTDEYRMELEEGTQVRVVGKSQVIRDQDGHPVRMITSLTDVTQQRELEEQLRRSQRLEAVGQLTGGIAHDFNNLLTAVIGSAESLIEDLHDRPQQKEVAELVMEAAERGAELVQRLLAFSRKQSLAPQSTECGPLVRSIVGMLRRTIGEDIEIHTEGAGAGIWCFADPTQLSSALLNLCLNARDAMPNGGRLRISVSRADGVCDNRGCIQLAVSDTGQGMSRETAARALEPFFTTKPPGRGSGLGLSSVYGFVTQSGGRMEIESAPGQGTTVRLLLPEGGPGAEVRGKTPLKLLASAPRHILLVEDDTLVRTQVERQLASLGYRVTSAGTGAEALQHLTQLDDVALLLTDVVMPGGMNGRQLADHARMLNPDLRVLFTSGYTEDAIVRDGRLVEGAEFLPKPYRRAALAQKLAKVLEHA